MLVSWKFVCALKFKFYNYYNYYLPNKNLLLRSFLKLLNLKQHNMGCGGSGPAKELMLSMGGLGKCSKTRFTLK